MTKKWIYIQILAASLLLLIFLFPIWRITLIAPQYPNGVILYIWLNKLSGGTPGTLQNINILNHYIGMKSIDAKAFKELIYFPYIVISLFVLGVAAALSRKRWLVFSWMSLLILAAVFGVIDFYLWLYDYGHNLDDMAAIKIPGQVYQPPLIGEKYLLNFLAKSYPDIGTAFYALSGCLSGFVFWKSK